jgi:hypothetical protein
MFSYSPTMMKIKSLVDAVLQLRAHGFVKSAPTQNLRRNIRIFDKSMALADC